MLGQMTKPPEMPTGGTTNTSKPRTTIQQLRPGQRIKTLLLVVKKREQVARTGNEFLALTLADKTGQVTGRVWDNVDRYKARFEVGDVVFVEGLVELFQKAKQLKIAHLERVPIASVDLSEFRKASRFKTKDMKRQLESLLKEEVRKPVMLKFLLAVIDDAETKAGFALAPAAKINHHAYLSGLLEHTLSMCQLALLVGRHYQHWYPDLLDTDYLIAGTLLHDMGKIWELSADLDIEYTDQGRLLGHTVIGVELVTRILDRLGIDDQEMNLRLKHLILSHHGKLEFGAVVKPQTPEAQVLHYIDQIDSRLNMFAEALNSTEQSWSDYVRPLGRSIFAGLDRRSVKSSKQVPEPKPKPVVDPPEKAVLPAPPMIPDPPPPIGEYTPSAALERLETIDDEQANSSETKPMDESTEETFDLFSRRS